MRMLPGRLSCTGRGVKSKVRHRSHHPSKGKVRHRSHHSSKTLFNHCLWQTHTAAASWECKQASHKSVSSVSFHYDVVHIASVILHQSKLLYFDTWPTTTSVCLIVLGLILTCVSVVQQGESRAVCQVVALEFDRGQFGIICGCLGVDVDGRLGFPIAVGKNRTPWCPLVWLGMKRATVLSWQRKVARKRGCQSKTETRHLIFFLFFFFFYSRTW